MNDTSSETTDSPAPSSSRGEEGENVYTPRSQDVEADHQFALALQASDEQVSSWSPVLPSVTKRQKVEESPSADSVSFASELEILLASTLQSSPSLAKVSIYSHVTDLLSRVNQFLTLDGPSKKQRTSVFADVCVVFTNWLQRTNAFPEELLLAVWLADSIWRWRFNVMLETRRFSAIPGAVTGLLTQQTDAGRALEQLHAIFISKFVGALASSKIGPMLTFVSQHNPPALHQFHQQFPQMAVTVLQHLPLLLQAFSISVQTCFARGTPTAVTLQHSSQPFHSWKALCEHLKTKLNLTFKQILSAFQEQSDILLLSTDLPAAYKAHILRFLLCELAPKHRYPTVPKDLEWFGTKLVKNCKLEVLHSLGNSYSISIIMQKGKPGSYLAAFLTGLETAQPSGLPMQPTSQFLIHVLDFLQEQAMAPKACLAIMTDLVEKLPDEGVEALQQAVTQLTQQRKLNHKMLTVLAELPFDIAAEAHQAAFQAGAFRDSKAVRIDARAYDIATEATSPEQSLQMFSEAFVSAHKLDNKAGYPYQARPAPDAGLVKHLAAFMTSSARMQQPDMTFDAGYDILKNSFPQVLSQSLESRAIQYTYSIQDICSSWSKAEHIPVAQGAALVYFQLLAKSLQGNQGKPDWRLMHGLRSMSEQLLNKQAWRKSMQLPLTVVLAIYAECFRTVTDAQMDATFSDLRAPVSLWQSLWHIADVVKDQSPNQQGPSATRLIALQASLQDKLDAFTRTDTIAQLPYRVLCQQHTSLLNTFASADEEAHPLLQLQCICTTLQENMDSIHAQVHPVNGNATSVLAGWAAFWSIMLHSGVKIPAALCSRSSQMAAETANVSLADIGSFTQLCSETLAMPEDSEDMPFLLHFLPQDSSLFKGYLLEYAKASVAGTDDADQLESSSAALSFVPSTSASSSFPHGGVGVVAHIISQARLSMLRLSTDPAVTMDLLDTAHSYMQAKNQEHELQVVFRYFMPAGVSVQLAAQQQLERFQAGILLNTWIDNLPEVLAIVEQYNLQKCKGTETAVLQQMLDNTFAKANRHQLAVSHVSEHLAAIQDICGIVTPLDLQLFSAAKHSDVFFNLMEEHQFFSSVGVQRFESIVQNLNATLMNEEYNMRVLADVQQARKLMAPFSQAKSMPDLFDKIRGLKLQAPSTWAMSQHAQLFACCRTVALHIQQIRMWFSSTTGQSLESITIQLDRLSSGNLHIHLHQTGRRTADLSIKYTIDASADATEQCLDEQGLNDLVKRLYLDQQDTSEVESGAPSTSDQELQTFSSRISSFLQLCQGVKEVAKLHAALSCSAHPHYLQQTYMYPLQADFPHHISILQAELQQWREFLSQLQNSRPELLFLSVRQLHACLESLTAAQRAGAAIAKTGRTIADVQSLLKLIPNLHDITAQQLSQKLPACLAGLDLQSEAHHRQRFDAMALAIQQITRSMGSEVEAPTAGQSAVLLTKDQDSALHKVLVRLYQGPPTPGSVFWASACSTEDELDHFLRRATFNRDQFCLARMELLPVQLREKVLQFQINTAAQRPHVSIVYIVSAGYDSIMTSMSWLPARHLACASAAGFRQAAHVQPEVHVYTGPACSGKTHAVHQQLQTATSDTKQTVQISLNEGASAASLIRSLSLLEPSETAAVIAINISSFAPISLINQLLFQLLVEGVVTDASTGLVFAMPQTAATLLVEVPAPISAHHEQTPVADAEPASSNFVSNSSLKSFPVLVECATQIHTVGAGSANVSTTFDTAAFRPPRSLALVALKLYFAPHKDQRRLIDSKYYWETQQVDQAAADMGITTANGQMSFAQVAVSAEEASSILQQLLQELVRLSGRAEVARLSRLQLHHFLAYLEPRAKFLQDHLHLIDEGFRYAGSILMETMLCECLSLVDKQMLQLDWARYPHSFLVYMQGEIKVVSLPDRDRPSIGRGLEPYPENVPIGTWLPTIHTKRKLFCRMPDRSELNDLDFLVSTLAAALLGQLGSRCEATVRNILAANKYVLTPDYTMKMLHIETRRQAKVPTIMNSETGVGKTKLLQMHSQIVNTANQQQTKMHDAYKEAVQSHAASLPSGADQLAASLQQAFNQLADIASNSMDVPAVLQSVLYLSAHLAGYTTMQVPTAAQTWQAQAEPVVTYPQPLTALLTQCQGIITEHVINQPVLQVGQFVYMQSELMNRGTLAQASTGQQVADAAQEAAAAWHLLPKHAQAAYTASGSTEAFKQGRGDLAAAFDLTADDVMADFSAFSDMLAAVAASLATEKHPLLTVLPMHAKVDQQQLADSLQPVITLAKACPDYTHTFFVDELNTSSIIGDFKDIFTDHRFMGQPLPPNIFLVAAINPYRPKTSQARADGSQASDDSYNVRPLPDSMLELNWDFGSLSHEQTHAYIAAKIQMCVAQGPSGISLTNLQDRKLADFIMQGQEFVKQHLGASAVSQRDLQRAFKFIDFFVAHHRARHVQLNDHELMHRCLLLSIAMTYYLRLPARATAQQSQGSLREQFCQMMSALQPPAKYHRKYAMPWNADMPWNDFEEVLADELEQYITGAQLPPGIAANLALMENFFCIAVCMQIKTPLIIVGTPGNSKTLSLKLAAERLRGEHGPYPFFRTFDAMDVFPYQCSEQSTSHEIKIVADRAIERQQQYNQHRQKSTVTVVLDEGGLPKDEGEALKIVHYFWDNPEVAFVTISNTPLDAAKTNRAAVVFRSEPTSEDLSKLAYSFFSANTAQECTALMRRCIHACCQAYGDLMSKEGTGEQRHLRDFHHFMKYFSRRCRDASGMPQVNTQTVIAALERNFGGTSAQEFRAIIDAFLQSLRQACGAEDFPVPQPCMYRNMLDVLKDSLADRHISGEHLGNQQASLSNVAARPILLIDQTGDDSASRMLLSHGVLDRDTEVFQLSQFPDDLSMEGCSRMISQLRLAIERGKKVFMMYTEPIHGSFYDLFNQFFTVRRDMQDNQEVVSLYVNIAVGPYSRPCRVHPRTQILVHTPARLVHALPPPFLDRFEKYIVSATDFWDKMCQQQSPQTQAVMKSVLQRLDQFIEVLGIDTFSGFSSHSTVVTALMATVQQQLLSTPATGTVHTDEIGKSLLRGAISKLLQIAKPHKMLQHRLTGCNLPDEYVAYYTGQQQHFSFKGWLTALLGNALPGLDQRMSASVEDCTDAPCQDGSISKKWVVTTTTCSSIEMLPQGTFGADAGGGDEQSRQMIAQLVHNSIDGLALYKLSGQLSTRQSCQDAVDAAAADSNIKTAIFLINMQQTSQRQVSMLRNMVDESSKACVRPSKPISDHMDCDSASSDDKTFILLLHHLPGELVTNQYPAHFLYGWSFWYLDSFTSQQKATKDVAASGGPPVDLWLQAAASGVAMPTSAKPALAGQDRAGFSQGAGLQAMQLLSVHASYGKATAKVRDTHELDARQLERCLIGLYDDGATPSQRWDALQPFLLKFGDAMLEHFTAAWGPDAIAHFAQQAADDVEAGLASNLEAALSTHYSTLQATFLASALHQLAGSDFDLLALVDLDLWEAAAGGDGQAALAEALLGCLETRTVAELHRLQGLSWTLCHQTQAGLPVRTRCPCFAAITAAVNTAKATYLQTEPQPDAADIADVQASLQSTLDSHKLGALCCHLTQNNVLRDAYLQELAAAQVALITDQQHEAILPFAVATLQRLWQQQPCLAGLHAQLLCTQQSLPVCFWLLGLAAQLPSVNLQHLVLSQEHAITAVADALAGSLVAIINGQPTADSFTSLKKWQEAVHAAAPHFSGKQSHGFRKALSVASHCIANAEAEHIIALAQLLRTIVNDCNQPQHSSQPGSYMLRLYESPHDELSVTQALVPIIHEVVQQTCAVQQASDSQLQELRVALRLAFCSDLEALSGWQDHLMSQLRDNARPQQLLQPVDAYVLEQLSECAQQPAAVLLTMLEPLQAELKYLPPIMRPRDYTVTASTGLVDSIYWHTFRQATTGEQCVHQGIFSALADIHAATPDPDASDPTAIMQSVHCVALTHACICMLGVQLSLPDKRQQLMAALSSCNAQGAAASIQSMLSASHHHQHLLLTSVSKAQPNNPHVLTEALEHPVMTLLGDWIKPWQQSFRRGSLAHQPHHMSIMSSGSYQALSGSFQATIVSHATETPQAPTAESQAAAVSFCDLVTAMAAQHSTREVSQMLLLIMYHQLFDVGPVSTALSNELHRLQHALGWQQELVIFQLLASGSASTLQHAEPGAAITSMFTRGPQADYDLASQRHIIINLLSVMVRVPRCHMATFMLQPEMLRQTWLVGSTYSSVTAHYDCGCVLDEQHMPVNPRAPLTDPASVYFVHILSFSALLMGHLLLPANHSKLYGPVLSGRQIHSYKGNQHYSDQRWLSDFMYMRIETSWHGLVRRAGLDAMGRILTLTAAIEGLSTALSDNPVTQPTYHSAPDRVQYESVLKDMFHQQLLRRLELEEKHVFEANGGRLQQELQTFASKLPWVYDSQISLLADAAAQRTTLSDYLALEAAQRTQQAELAANLIAEVLAQQGKWEHLQLLPLGLEVYQWANQHLAGLTTEEAVRSTSLHQYLQRAKHKDKADAQHMIQVYEGFKRRWNAFHKAQDSYMRDECQDDARFLPITDDTPLSFFISWQDAAADDYLLRVLRNVLDIQNKFMAVFQDCVPSAAVRAAPASLLRDPTLALGILDKDSLSLQSILPAYVQSSTSPLPSFDLRGLAKRIISWLQAKSTITDNLSDIRHVFQPWQPSHAQCDANRSDATANPRPLELGAGQNLPAQFKLPLPAQQASTISSHIGSMAFEQLQGVNSAMQQVATAVVHQTVLLVPGSSDKEVHRRLQPTDSLSAAIVAANPDAKLKNADFVSGLTVAHVHAVVWMAAEKLAGQSHLYAHLPEFVKLPLPDTDAQTLQGNLQRGLMESNAAEELVELLKDLQSYEGMPGQGSALLANANKPLGQFCANFGYDADAFPLTSLPDTLRCEHYVATVQIMKKVLAAHWKHSTTSKQQRSFTEDANQTPGGSVASATMSLPVWVDTPLYEVSASPVKTSVADKATCAVHEDLMDWSEEVQSQDAMDESPAHHLSGFDKPKAVLSAALPMAHPEALASHEADSDSLMASGSDDADDDSLLASGPDSPSLLADHPMLPAAPTLENTFGAKEAAWLQGAFMSGFANVLQPIGVHSADDLMLLTPAQAQSIKWPESLRPYTAPKKRLQQLLQQISQEQRLLTVLHRFQPNVSQLLSIDEFGADVADEVVGMLQTYDSAQDLTVDMTQVQLPSLAQQVLLLELQGGMQ